jgi:chitinase
LTDDQAYLKTGATFSIGFESDLYPTFTTSMASTIIEDAKKHNYGMISMWSMGRDAMLEQNKGISKPFTFSKELRKYENIYD